MATAELVRFGGDDMDGSVWCLSPLSFPESHHSCYLLLIDTFVEVIFYARHTGVVASTDDRMVPVGWSGRSVGLFKPVSVEEKGSDKRREG